MKKISFVFLALIFISFYPAIAHSLSSSENSTGDKESIVSNEWTPLFQVEGGCNQLPRGTIEFTTSSSLLSARSKTFLDQLGSKMKMQQGCKTVIKGHGNGDKLFESYNEDRFDKILVYMETHFGIAPDRFVFKMDAGDEVDVLELSALE